MRPAALQALVLGLAGALGVAGCASTPGETAGTPVSAAAYESPPVPRDWRASARAAIRTEQDSATVSLRWRQRGDAYRVDLRGPMGSGAVRITGDGQRARLRTAAGEDYRASSARRLVRRSTGYDLPVENLVWWLRGRPVPGAGGSVRVNAWGLPARIEQDGWTIRYEGYTKVGAYELPQRVEAVRGELQVRVAELRWQVSG